MTKSPRYAAPLVRPVDHALHPIETGNYRIATATSQMAGSP